MAPVARPPTTSGWKIAEPLEGSPATAAGLPYLTSAASMFSSMASGSRVSITCLRKPITGKVMFGKWTPRSIW